MQGTSTPSTSPESERPSPSSSESPDTSAQSSAQADVLIEMKNVHKSFGSKPILRGANITIRRGEAVGIIGGSGTGKSTTLRIMAGLLMPDVVWLDRYTPNLQLDRYTTHLHGSHREFELFMFVLDMQLSKRKASITGLQRLCQTCMTPCRCQL